MPQGILLRIANGGAYGRSFLGMHWKHAYRKGIMGHNLILAGKEQLIKSVGKNQSVRRKGGGCPAECWASEGKRTIFAVRVIAGTISGFIEYENSKNFICANYPSELSSKGFIKIYLPLNRSPKNE